MNKIMNKILIYFAIFAIIFSVVICVQLSPYVTEYYEYWYNESYFYVWLRVINWNLRKLDVYPNVEIIYLYRMNKDTSDEYWQAGVYPYLDAGLEERIRDMGYPFNLDIIQYVGTNEFTDRYTYWGHPLAEAELAPRAWIDELLYPCPYYRDPHKIFR